MRFSLTSWGVQEHDVPHGGQALLSPWLEAGLRASLMRREVTSQALPGEVTSFDHGQISEDRLTLSVGRPHLQLGLPAGEARSARAPCASCSLQGNGHFHLFHYPVCTWITSLNLSSSC